MAGQTERRRWYEMEQVSVVEESSLIPPHHRQCQGCGIRNDTVKAFAFTVSPGERNGRIQHMWCESCASTVAMTLLAAWPSDEDEDEIEESPCW